MDLKQDSGQYKIKTLNISADKNEGEKKKQKKANLTSQ